MNEKTAKIKSQLYFRFILLRVVYELTPDSNCDKSAQKDDDAIEKQMTKEIFILLDKLRVTLQLQNESSEFRGYMEELIDVIISV